MNAEEKDFCEVKNRIVLLKRSITEHNNPPIWDYAWIINWMKRIISGIRNPCWGLRKIAVEVKDGIKGEAYKEESVGFTLIFFIDMQVFHIIVLILLTLKMWQNLSNANK